MTQHTWNRGLGYAGPYNDSDFTSEFLGSASGQWTWNRGLGFAGPWNDSSFVTGPGSPGGDYQEGIISVDAGITANVLEIDTWEVQSTLYAPLGVVVTSAGLNSIARNVDRIRLEPRQQRIRLEPI